MHHRVERDAELEREGRRAHGVRRVVTAGDGQLDGAELAARAPVRGVLEREPAAGPAALVARDAVVRRVVPAVRARTGNRGRQTRRDRVVRAHDARAGYAPQEVLERAGQARETAVVVEMIGFDVGDDRRVRFELEERPVALVGLDDEPLAVVVRRVRPDLVDVAADQEAGMPSRGAQDQGEHRGGRGLAVAPRHRDRPPGRDESAQGLGPAQDGDAALAGGGDLGVGRRDRRRHDDRVGPVGHVGAVVTHRRRDTEQLEAGQGGRRLQVRAAHVVTHPREHLGDSAHPRSADTDDVDPARRGQIEGLARRVHARAPSRLGHGITGVHAPPLPRDRRPGRRRRRAPATGPRRASPTACPVRRADRRESPRGGRRRAARPGS